MAALQSPVRPFACVRPGCGGNYAPDQDGDLRCILCGRAQPSAPPAVDVGRCKRPGCHNAPGEYSHCAACRAYLAMRVGEYMARRRSQGLCLRSGCSTVVGTEARHCRTCRVSKTHVAKARQRQRRERGLCIELGCPELPGDSHTRCRRHRARIARYQAARRRKGR